MAAPISVSGLLALALLALAPGSLASWSRSILVYHSTSRSQTHWQQHLLRVDSSGGFNPATSHWLFDSAILTARQVNGKKIHTAEQLTGDDCLALIQMLKGDVQMLNGALGAVSTIVPRPAHVRLNVYVAIPYFNVRNKNFTITGGPVYNLSQADQRSAAMYWYLDQLRTNFANASTLYPNLHLAGVYYHREDVVDQDVLFVQDFNDYAHGIGMQTVFVPYYDAPNVWYSKGLGFDVVVVQPNYAWLSSIDGSIVRGDRLYSTGNKGVAHGVGMEYELRNNGSREVDYWIAHQYLAISQFTRVSANPQVFFVSDFPNILDRVSSQAAAEAVGPYTWQTYTDLCDYLNGSTIWNYEVGIQPPNQEVVANVRQIVWPSAYANLASIRLDFNDPDPSNIWRGRLAVLVNGNPEHSSYAARAGVGEPGVSPSYQSVFVPLASERVATGTALTIQIIKETNSPWPNVLRLVGALYEPKYIASPIVGQASRSSNPQTTKNVYLDVAPTHLGYAYDGKLTNGLTSSVGKWDDAVAFLGVERRFTVTIDLTEQQIVSRVVMITSRDQGSGVNWPNNTVAYVAGNCEPAEWGTLAVGAGSCPPEYASGAPVLAITYSSGPGKRYDGTLTLNMAQGAAGRFVTVSGVAHSFCMMHEISVYGGTNGDSLLSLQKPYRVTPKPGVYSGGNWSDDSRLLTDGAVFGDWISGQQNTVGIIGDGGGSVETTFLQPRTGFAYAVIWVTRGLAAYKIKQPDTVTMSWRDASGVWSPGSDITVNECANALAPCAKLPLAAVAHVTGIRGVFGPTSSWYMVSEISLMN